MITNIFLAVVTFFLNALSTAMPSAGISSSVESAVSTYMYYYNTVNVILPVSVVLSVLILVVTAFFGMSLFKVSRFIIQAIRG